MTSFKQPTLRFRTKQSVNNIWQHFTDLIHNNPVNFRAFTELLNVSISMKESAFYTLNPNQSSFR